MGRVVNNLLGSEIKRGASVILDLKYLFDLSFLFV